MIEKLLNRFGYFKQKEHTVDELSSMLSNKLGEFEDDMNEQAEVQVFSAARGVEGLAEYLRIAAQKDVQRYFAASTKEEQLMIRGSFARTNYLRSRIMNGGVKKTKLDGTRYM